MTYIISGRYSTYSWLFHCQITCHTLVLPQNLYHQYFFPVFFCRVSCIFSPFLFSFIFHVKTERNYISLSLGTLPNISNEIMTRSKYNQLLICAHVCPLFIVWSYGLRRRGNSFVCQRYSCMVWKQRRQMMA